MARTKAKAGRFYEIMAEVGNKYYVLTDEISIPRMGIEARNRWREASYLALAEGVLDAQALAIGTLRDRVDHSETIERALLGTHYEACKELFTDDAAAWDKFLSEVADFNKVDGTDKEDDEAEAQGKGESATPDASQ